MLNFDKSVKLALSVNAVSCIGSGSVCLSKVSKKGVPVAVQTEPSTDLVLLKCCNTQTDNASSIGTEQTHSRDTDKSSFGPGQPVRANRARKGVQRMSSAALTED